MTQYDQPVTRRSDDIPGLLTIDGADKIERTVLIDDGDNGSLVFPELPIDDSKSGEEMKTETISLED